MTEYLQGRGGHKEESKGGEMWQVEEEADRIVLEEDKKQHRRVFHRVKNTRPSTQT